MEKAKIPVQKSSAVVFIVILLSLTAAAEYEGPSYEVAGTYYSYELGTDAEDKLGIDDIGVEELLGKSMNTGESFAMFSSSLSTDGTHVYDGKSGFYISDGDFAQDNVLSYLLCVPEPGNENRCKEKEDVEPQRLGMVAFNDAFNDLEGVSVGYETDEDFEEDGEKIYSDLDGEYDNFDDHVFFGEFDYFDGDAHEGGDGHYRYGVSQRIFEGPGDFAVFEFCDPRGTDECYEDFSDDVNGKNLGEFSWGMFGENVFEESRFGENKIAYGSIEFDGAAQTVDFSDGYGDVDEFDNEPVVVVSLNDEGEDIAYAVVDDITEESFELSVCEPDDQGECEIVGDSEDVAWMAVGGETAYDDIDEEEPVEFTYNTPPEAEIITEDNMNFETAEPVLNVSFKDPGEDPLTVRFYDETNNEMFSCDQYDCGNTPEIIEVKRSGVPQSGNAGDYERGDEGWIALVLDGTQLEHGETYEWSVKYGEYSVDHYNDCYYNNQPPLACLFDKEGNEDPDYTSGESGWENTFLYNDYRELGPQEFQVIVPIEIDDACEHEVEDPDGNPRDSPYEVGDTITFEPGEIEHDGGDIDDVKVCADQLCDEELCSGFDSDFEECETMIDEDWDSIQNYYLWVEADGFEMVGDETCQLSIDKDLFYVDSEEVSVSFEHDDFINVFIANEGDVSKTYEVEVGELDGDGSFDVHVEGDDSRGDRATVEVGPGSTETVRVNFMAAFCGGTCSGEMEISVFDRMDAEEQTETIHATIDTVDGFVGSSGPGIVQIAVMMFLALFFYGVLPE